jgi:hypothetical protein
MGAFVVGNYGKDGLQAAAIAEPTRSGRRLTPPWWRSRRGQRWTTSHECGGGERYSFTRERTASAQRSYS